MPSRLTKLRPESKLKSSSIPPDSPRDFPIHQDPDRETGLLVALLPSDSAQAEGSPKSTPTKPRLVGFLHGRKSSRSTLSPAPQDALNSMSTSRTNAVKSKPLPPSPAPSPQIPSRMASTIRPVRSFDNPRDSGGGMEEDSSFESASASASRSSAFSSSVASNGSGISAMSQQIPNGGSDSTVRLKPTAADDVAQISPQLPPPTTHLSLRPSFDIPHRESSRTALTTLPNGRQPVPQPSESTPDISDTHQLTTTTSNNGGWDSTIGKAGLGKTGRVINKLVSDNESLKRDIKIERLRADESRQTARLLEDKMDRMASEYESRLLEANVTKTLLARKERQVESLTAVVALERAKASSALDRERTWKDEMEKVKAEAKREVEEAHGRAALMEGRYNAIAGHWAEQGREVRAAMAKMKGRVEQLVEERRADDDKIATLREVCDQQDGNIRELARQKEEIARQFERYKAEQEKALRDIKTLAARREAEQEAVLRESRDVLDKLKWALNVKENVAWAE